MGAGLQRAPAPGRGTPLRRRALTPPLFMGPAAFRCVALFSLHLNPYVTVDPTRPGAAYVHSRERAVSRGAGRGGLDASASGTAHAAEVHTMALYDSVTAGDSALGLELTRHLRVIWT